MRAILVIVMMMKKTFNDFREEKGRCGYAFVSGSL